MTALDQFAPKIHLAKTEPPTQSGQSDGDAFSYLGSFTMNWFGSSAARHAISCATRIC
jgi:hypothetical protein